MDNLNKIETSVFRAFNMEDGLLDMFLGLMLLPFAMWIYSPDDGLSQPMMLVLVYAFTYPTMLFVKKRVITPRIGSVKPGPATRVRSRKMMITSIVMFTITIALVLLTIFASREASQHFAGIPLVFWIFSTCVVMSTTLVAWIVNTPRIVLYGFLAAVSIPVDAVFLMRTGYPPSALVPVLVMIGVGIFLFNRFLKKHPRQTNPETT